MESGEIDFDSLKDILSLDCWPRQPQWIEFMCLESRAMIRALAERELSSMQYLYLDCTDSAPPFFCLPRPPQGLPWHPGMILSDFIDFLWFKSVLASGVPFIVAKFHDA